MLVKIHAKQRAGLNQTQIANELGIAQGTVSIGLRQKPPELPRDSKRSSKTASRRPPAKRAEAPKTRDELRERLGALIATIEDLAAKAQTEGNLGVVLQIARVSNGLIKELARLTPAPKGDEEESPDMNEAAKRARQKILERVRRRARGNA